MSKTVAIIEDNVAIAEMYKFKLSQKGYNVIMAHDGKQGLALVTKTPPDFILLDLMMPEMTGDEMLEKLRATDWGSNIRVCILTNISKDEAPQSLRLLHVDRYIVKAHYTPTQVAELVHDLLKGDSIVK